MLITPKILSGVVSSHHLSSPTCMYTATRFYTWGHRCRSQLGVRGIRRWCWGWLVPLLAMQAVVSPSQRTWRRKRLPQVWRVFQLQIQWLPNLRSEPNSNLLLVVHHSWGWQDVASYLMLHVALPCVVVHCLIYLHIREHLVIQIIIVAKHGTWCSRCCENDYCCGEDQCSQNHKSRTRRILIGAIVHCLL